MGPSTGGYRPLTQPAGPTGPPGQSSGPTPYGGTPRAGGTPFGGHSSGSYPAAPGRATSAADNKLLWIGLGVVAAIAIIVIIVVSMSGGDESGGGSGSGGEASAGEYTEANEQAFMDECLPSGGEPLCTCSWTKITETIPFDRFVEMNATLEADPNAAIDELSTIRAECLAAS